MPFVILLLLLVFSFNVRAVPGSEPQPHWGIALGVRSATIPFETDDETVYDILPLMFVNTKHAYLYGMEAGVHLWQQPDQQQVTAFTRYRFSDIPEEFQNQVRSDNFDIGLRYRYIPHVGDYYDVELLSDDEGHPLGHLRYGTYHRSGAFEWRPQVQVDWRSREFNSNYYGFGLLDIGSDVGLTGKVEMRYHVTSNLYLLGQVSASVLGDALNDAETIDSRYGLETFAGISLFPTPEQQSRYTPPVDLSGHFLRVAHGWATPSDMITILTTPWNIEEDQYNNQLTSVFYGYPLSDTLFSLPIEVYFMPGLARHYSSEVQSGGWEGVMAIKAYYTWKLPVKLRFGLAEGLSYISNITHIERENMDRKGYRPSKLMNYLDVSVEVNLGDLFRTPQLSNVWAGYSLHHRSSIFESASQFGRIKGGSNYNTFTLQWDF